MDTTTSTTLSSLAQGPAGSAPRKPVLLVVDDQAVNIQVMYQTFANDHQVLMARSGQAALQVCENHSPDLIVLDVMMPDMDGYEVCQRLKADARTHDIPVIFVTARHDEMAETRGLDVGAVDFISKPINPAIVRARVKTHLTLKAQSDQLRQWVYIDGLTGLNNRRHFDEALAQEWARATRQRSMISVVLIDVDHFKHYNDHYGHMAGDECLRRIATTIRNQLKRPADLAARYGGEEFACILPETGHAGAMHFARSVGDAIRALGMAHATAAHSDVVTISLGVCSGHAQTGVGPQAMLESADTQLYAAKAQGRDRVNGICIDPA